MKDFVKMTLAVLAGLFIASVLSFILGISMLASLAVAGSSKTVLPKSMVLELDMSGLTVCEQSLTPDPIAMIQGNSLEGIGIWEAVNALNTAATDPAVKCILLKTDGSMTGLAHVQELRQALNDFRQTSGKPIVSYIESPSTGSYYLASVADKVYMTSHSGATTMVNGISTQMFFLGDLLKKFGVNMQLIRHGKYKSAGEMYTRGSSSAENREQYQRLVDSMWDILSEEIASSRSISEEQLNYVIDNLELCIPEDFTRCGLVDELVTREEMEAKVATLYGSESYKDVKKVGFKTYAESKPYTSKAKQKIAIVYAEGEIVDGSDLQGMAGDRFAKIIAKVREDDNVKAVVLRVNSPGGSVLASDKIKHEVDLLCKQKPVVASFAEYAASGGYWISNGCSRIFSDNATLTGSIGVFGLIPDFSKTFKDVAHVGVENINSNKHSDMYSLMRPFDQSEYNYMLRSIEDIYDRFTGMVAEGRGMEKEAVDAIGQGRVWTGADGIGIGLVDEIGTLSDAVAYAAELAGDSNVESWNVSGYPKPLDTMTQLVMTFTGKGAMDEDALVRTTLQKLGNARFVARLPYDIKIR